MGDEQEKESKVRTDLAADRPEDKDDVEGHTAAMTGEGKKDKPAVTALNAEKPDDKDDVAGHVFEKTGEQGKKDNPGLQA